jgi:hypothetical protein
MYQVSDGIARVCNRSEAIITMSGFQQVRFPLREVAHDNHYQRRTYTAALLAKYSVARGGFAVGENRYAVMSEKRSYC